MYLNKTSLCAVCMSLFASSAFAIGYDRGDFGMRLAGHGTTGVTEPNFESVVFMNDWLLRGQMDYKVNSKYKIGLMYAIDELAVYQKEWSRDAFAFVESNGLGRVEIGFTDSVVTKLGLGLPDVGGMRINDNPLFYREIEPGGPVISNTTLTSSRYNLRANVMTDPRAWAQFGGSVAAPSHNYNYAADFGVRFRNPHGKTKTSYTFGASYIDNPQGMHTDIYAPAVTASARAQFSAGLNVQYNSWIIGASTRVIYDSDAINPPADGVAGGVGVSYDLLKYSISASYLFSGTGIWDSDFENYYGHTGIASFRYKYSENVDGWLSAGMSTGMPFISAGIRLKF